MQSGLPAPTIRLVLLAVATLLAVLLMTSPSHAASGGVGAPGQAAAETKQGGGYADARLLPNGEAVAPASAPRRVERAIAAANRIRKAKYLWGGGHGSFEDRGYDCSGAVSYLLHGGGMLKAPLASGGLAGWGREGRGKWISVYASAGHTYAVVAGLRWDTSGGPGPRWHRDARSPGGYEVRHFNGY